MKRNKLFLLDVYPILYRSHFAMLGQHLVTTKGLNTSAILGFCNYLFQILFKEKPSHIAAAFDNSSTERLAVLDTYKATREKMPDEIAVAKTYVTSIIDALNIKKIYHKGSEADDVIGTIALKASMEGMEVYIVSPDKDFAQLASDRIFLYRPSYKGVNFEIVNGEQVVSKYGVPPAQIPDLLALKGDTSDNIPGVPKIGEKTAIELLQTYSSLEELLANKDKVRKASIRETLISNEKQAILSKKLAVINTALPIEFDKEEFELKAPQTDKLVSLLDELEFVRLKERIFSNAFYKNALDHKETAGIREEIKSYPELQWIESEEEFVVLLKKIKAVKKFFFTTSFAGRRAQLWMYVDQHLYSFYLAHGKLFSSFRRILESEEITKITYNIKPLLKFLNESGVNIKGKIHDLLLEHYTLTPDANHQLDKIISQETGKSFPFLSSEEKPLLEVTSLPLVEQLLSKRLLQFHQQTLYNKIDLPLATVLATIELNGIKVDEEALKDTSDQLQHEMDLLQDRIYELAGEPFNVNSPRQVSGVLSRIVKDHVIKKTKTGQLSTSESTLQEFAGEYEIAEHLLRYRRLSKIVTTYTESLPKYIDAKTGRIHADFQQVTTATGRLSCLNPNLQNLPIRTEEGREIRRAVIPSNNDYVILSADYSQIELRLLAGLSKDVSLSKAFSDHQDVHTITAAKVFNVTEKNVTEEMRSKAKMVNYGIAYGISAFGLSQRLRIPLAEGKDIIQQYFSKFPGIKGYIEVCIEFARTHGYSQTITNRRRYIEDINSKNGTERRAAERIAINAPIQGLAADLIKLSMIDLDAFIKSEKLKTKMILQVHDELVFEVAKDELEYIAPVIKYKMEKAIDFPVPLEVNVGYGTNWLDLNDFNFK